MAVFVLNKDGKPLMPTTRYGKVRHWLKEGKAVIVKRNPFTIQLQFDTAEYVQPLELCMDTGYQHIGLSIKSPAREYVSEERALLTKEKENHDSQRKTRRTRRNRLRYRFPRWGHHSKKRRWRDRYNNVQPKKNRIQGKSNRVKGWLAPSLKNKADRHVDLVKLYTSVLPIKDVCLEMGQFDTQVLKALNEGKPIPAGLDYQHGPMYGQDTVRLAVFQRDNYTCQICGKSAIKDKVILHEHHMLFWKDRHGNSMDELLTVCTRCHTPANHQKGGKLWGIDKHFSRQETSAFMNSVRWYIGKQVKTFLPAPVTLHLTYGAVTHRTRLNLNLEKSHANDAFAIGNYHPVSRAKTDYYQKRRRNDRCLEKFYDAQYIDQRDMRKIARSGIILPTKAELADEKKPYKGKRRLTPYLKSGMELGCQRTNRRMSRQNKNNQRIFHGLKINKGQRRIRKQRYLVQSGTTLLYRGCKIVSKGLITNGAYSTYDNARYQKKSWTEKTISLFPLVKTKTLQDRNGRKIKRKTIKWRVQILTSPGGWLKIAN